MSNSWEAELATLLTDLLAVQDELLKVLTRKRELLLAPDPEGLTTIAEQEEELIQRLQGCVKRRRELLSQAKQEGLPSGSIEALTQALPRNQRSQLDDQVQLARSRARLLQHQSLTNWVVVQRTLIHLSQMLEIIATGGRLQPTYGEGEPVQACGGLVDQEI